MPGLTGNSRAAQVYASQGESTPAAPLPDKFKARNQVTDAAPGLVPLFRPSDHLALVPGMPSAVVLRAPRMVGMRYLYAFGHRAMNAVTRDAAGATANPFISAFQRMLHGPIKNAGFNDALYQAGYPGFNLGLSFAVQTLQTQIQRPPEAGLVTVTSMNKNVNARPIYQRPIGRELGK